METAASTNVVSPSRRHSARRHSSIRDNVQREGPQKSSGRKQTFRKANNGADAGDHTAIDDTADVPVLGFLKGGNISLPTYKRNDAPEPDFSRLRYVALTIQDVLSTILKNTELARFVLWETARLKQRKRDRFRFKSLKLSDEARQLDKKLVKVREVLWESYDLIEDSGPDGNGQRDVIKGKAFEKAQGMKFNIFRSIQYTLLFASRDTPNLDWNNS